MKVVNKKRLIKSILIGVFIITIITICTIHSFANNKESITTEITYTISKGETLWSIAKRYKQDNQDIRDYIYKIEKLNNMTSAMVYEGQTIKILLTEDK